MNFKSKKLTKLLISSILFLMIFTCSLETFAATTATTSFELVDDTSCNITIDDIAKFEKKITDFDKDGRSATISLTITNTAEPVRATPAEVMLVIDNSSSMGNKVGNQTRKQAVINSANTLVEKLFDAATDMKIGIVSFSSLDNTEDEVREGTINDSQLLLALSNSKSDVKNAISKIENDKGGARTNIEAGITRARDNYSSNANTNRYMILLSDGVPNNALNGIFSDFTKASAPTKAKLQEIKNSGITVIGAMIGLDDEKVESQSKKTYKTLAEEIFGTPTNPTINNYYHVTDSQIEDTIAKNIFNDVFPENNTLKDLVIKDYFPQEIIDNFNFEYVASPNIGTVSQVVDKSDNSITWTISELKEGEVGTLSYKLTLKDDYDESINNKVLPTNEKVEITGSRGDEKIAKTSTDSPKVKVTAEVPEEPTDSKKPDETPTTPAPKDDTTASTKIPQTGDNSAILLGAIATIVVTTIGRMVYLKRK